VDWILTGGQEPKTIYDANFNPSRLYTLRTRNSAAYKGIYALLLGEGLRDWLSNSKIDIQTYFSQKIDVHHIFPVAWCIKNKKPSDMYDCIINKTPLSGGTNKFVSGDAPSRYLERLANRIEVSDAEFTQIIQTHLLDLRHLANDDFEEFLKDRKERLLHLIEKATGKQIPREESLPEEGVFLPEENEENAMDDEIIA